MANQENPQRWLDKPGNVTWIRGIIQQFKLIWRLMRDRRVPVWLKAVPFLSVAYLLVPADVVPDLFVGLGQLDDLAVIAFGMRLFVELSPPSVVYELKQLIQSEYQAEHEWKVIDGTAEHLDEPD